MTFYEVYYGLKYANELLRAKMKKKIQLREKESNEIFKVKNLCICSAMIKKHTTTWRLTLSRLDKEPMALFRPLRKYHAWKF